MSTSLYFVSIQVLIIINCLINSIGSSGYNLIYNPENNNNNNNLDLFSYNTNQDVINNNIIQSNNINPIEDLEDESNNQQILALEEAQEMSLANFRNSRNKHQQQLEFEREEVYILEEKDYPKSLYEHYKGVGQVSGITTLPSGNVVIFHRGPTREWTNQSFNANYSLNLTNGLPASENLIKQDTILIIDGDDGSSISSLGSNLFYMPHSVTSDNQGNLWLSDVGRHQVMRLPANMLKEEKDSIAKNNMSNIWPDIILGEAFVPGSDFEHFCQPSEIKVSSDGRLIFVADGYCNQRIMVFLGGSGKFLKSFGEDLNMKTVHSLTLIEERNLICAADRDNARIVCFKAGLDNNLVEIGRPVLSLDYPLGRVFAIEALSIDHLLVSSNQIGTNKYDVALLNPFSHQIKQVWTSSDLLAPHSLAKTKDGLYVYAADISSGAFKKVFKFHVIKRIR